MPVFVMPASAGFAEANPCHSPADGKFCSGAGGARLVPSTTMPPKSVPIVLVYGGSFNPPHAGHVAAVKESIGLLEREGYTVAKVVVSPTPDKLLRAKLGDELYPLDKRTELTAITFKGMPKVEVNSGPAKEAEATEGKIRRTQLADYVGRHHENATIVNVTGEDAAVGSPPGTPSLYKGDKGTAHEHYNYLTVARIGGYSSTAIRTALAHGTSLPAGAMSKEAESYLRAMKRKKG